MTKKNRTYVDANVPESELIILRVPCDMFVCPALAYKLSHPDYEYLKQDALHHAQLNSGTEYPDCAMRILTGEKKSTLTVDNDRTSTAIKICRGITENHRFAHVWWTEKMFPGGEHFFDSQLQINYTSVRGNKTVTFPSTVNLDSIPLDVLMLLKEGDTLEWTVELFDKHHSMHHLRLVGYVKQLGHQYGNFGRFEEAIQEVARNEWNYVLRFNVIHSPCKNTVVELSTTVFFLIKEPFLCTAITNSYISFIYNKDMNELNIMTYSNYEKGYLTRVSYKGINNAGYYQ